MIGQYKNKKQVFIIGIGRSGTTVLSRVLNTHPKLHCLPEANFLVFFLNSYKNKTSFTRKEIDLIFDQIRVYSLSHPWFAWWTFDQVKAKENVYKASENNQLDYISLCKLISVHFEVVNENKESAEILIDKNPSNTLYVNKISQCIPSAQYIWVVRDFRANVLSRKQNTDLKSGNVAFYAQRWVLFNKIAKKFSQHNKKNVCFLRYEDFVKQNDTETKKLFEFLNVSVEEVLNNNKIHAIRPDDFEIAPLIKERIHKHYQNWNKPLNDSRLDSWKEHLSENEIRICDAICGDLGSDLGYSVHFQLNLLQRLWIKIRYAIPILKARIDVSKDLLIFYASAALKLNRLKRRYKKLGLLND